MRAISSESWMYFSSIDFNGWIKNGPNSHPLRFFRGMESKILLCIIVFGSGCSPLRSSDGSVLPTLIYLDRLSFYFPLLMAEGYCWATKVIRIGYKCIFLLAGIHQKQWRFIPFLTCICPEDTSKIHLRVVTNLLSRKTPHKNVL